MRLSILVAFGLVSTICSADTVDFNWNYTGTGIEAHGTFVTSTTGTAGQYLITAITGERNGAAITAFDTVFGNPDELLFYPATNTGTALTPTFLDNNGFSFDIGATQYNIFTSVARPTVVENNGGPAIVFSATLVPEPRSSAMLITGLFALMGVMRYRKSAKSRA